MNSKERSELVIHPLRLRIVNLLIQESMTPSKLLSKMKDISQATLYRHLKKLENAGIIKIIASNPVRGTVEKTYGIKNQNDIYFSEDDIKNFTREDHERCFTVFTANLNYSFYKHLTTIEKTPERAGLMGYHTHPAKLDPDDLSQFKIDFLKLLNKYKQKGEQSGQTELFNISTIILPEGYYES